MPREALHNEIYADLCSLYKKMSWHRIQNARVRSLIPYPKQTAYIISNSIKQKKISASAKVETSTHVLTRQTSYKWDVEAGVESTSIF